MDQTTHDIRRDYWLDIVTRCSQRTDGSTVIKWLTDNGIKVKAYYYWLRKFRREAALQIKSEVPTISSEQSVTFAEIPIQQLNETNPMTGNLIFKPDAVINIKGITMAVSNSISDSLLSELIRGVNNAC